MSSDLDVMKNNVVTQMFVDTADQNYLIARWAYHRGLFTDFFWNSVHALEKYLNRYSRFARSVKALVDALDEFKVTIVKGNAKGL